MMRHCQLSYHTNPCCCTTPRFLFTVNSVTLNYCCCALKVTLSFKDMLIALTYLLKDMFVSSGKQMVLKLRWMDMFLYCIFVRQKLQQSWIFVGSYLYYSWKVQFEFWRRLICLRCGLLCKCETWSAPPCEISLLSANMSPLQGENPIFGPLSKNNTGMAALHTGLPVIKVDAYMFFYWIFVRQKLELSWIFVGLYFYYS